MNEALKRAVDQLTEYDPKMPYASSWGSPGFNRQSDAERERELERRKLPAMKMRETETLLAQLENKVSSMGMDRSDRSMFISGLMTCREALNSAMEKIGA